MAMSGGLLWVAGALLLWHLRGSINFVDRDDGIITLAHAKSLVQSGSISVGAFGDRVAGFSAPLHFMVGVVYFLLGGSSYQLLGRALGFLCLIGIGATTGALVGEELQTERAPIRWAALVAVAGLQLGSWSFFGWQFSGMENPIGALLLIVIMWRWDRVNASLPSAVWLGVMLGLLSIVRLDTITLAAPLTAVIVIESLMRREERSLRHVGALALPACLISLTAVTLWYLYFGSVGSTTIANRSRDAAATLDLLGIAALGVAGWLATLWAVHRMSRQTPGRNRAATGGGVLLAGCAMLIAAAALSVRVGDGRVGGLVMTAMWSVGVIWTAGAVVSGWSLPAARPKRLAAYTTVAVWVPCYVDSWPQPNSPGSRRFHGGAGALVGHGGCRGQTDRKSAGTCRRDPPLNRRSGPCHAHGVRSRRPDAAHRRGRVHCRQMSRFPRPSIWGGSLRRATRSCCRRHDRRSARLTSA